MTLPPMAGVAGAREDAVRLEVGGEAEHRLAVRGDAPHQPAPGLATGRRAIQPRPTLLCMDNPY